MGVSEATAALRAPRSSFYPSTHRGGYAVSGYDGFVRGCLGPGTVNPKGVGLSSFLLSPSTSYMLGSRLRLSPCRRLLLSGFLSGAPFHPLPYPLPLVLVTKGLCFSFRGDFRHAVQASKRRFERTGIRFLLHARLTRSEVPRICAMYYLFFFLPFWGHRLIAPYTKSYTYSL